MHRQFMRRASPIALLMALASFAGRAHAETTISTATTSPVYTATANAGGADDINITTDGSITLSSSTSAVTLNSANTVTNSGAISAANVSTVRGIEILGGNSGSVNHAGSITLSEDYSETDSDSDGDGDGAFATGGDRIGILLHGPGAFTGDITSSGSIIIRGTNSTGIDIASTLNGSLSSSSSITVNGDNARGVRVASPVAGSVSLTGAISTLGANATGVSVEAPIAGSLRIQSSISATGYRYTSRASDPSILDADDLLQSGSAVSITADIGGGILLDTYPADNDSSNDDEDGDGVSDSSEGTAAITTYSGAPALKIGDSGLATITIGAGSGYGLNNLGGISAYGVYDRVAATALRIENANIAGGIKNSGTITAMAYDANAASVSLGAGANLPTLENYGTISTYAVSEGAIGAHGVIVEAGATLPRLLNTGSISAGVSGEAGGATAIRDLSNTLRQIDNYGAIAASHTPTDDEYDTDDSDTNANNEKITGAAIAIDLSAQTLGSTVTQYTNDSTPSITGDIYFGAGADTLNITAGTVTGDIRFGAGADRLLIDGGSTVTGALFDADNNLAISIGTGKLALSNTTQTTISSLDLGPAAVLSQRLDPATGQNGSLIVTGGANLQSGSAIAVNITSLIPEAETFRVLTAGSITGAADVSVVDQPFLYSSTLSQTATAIDITLSRKTAGELGLSDRQAKAYAPAFAAWGTDSDLAAAYLGLTTAESFKSAFDQLLPAANGGEVELSRARMQSLQMMTLDRLMHDGADPDRSYGWAQEIGFAANQKANAVNAGFDGHGLGLALGIDKQVGPAAFGLGGALAWGDVDAQSGHDEGTTIQSVDLFAQASTTLGPVFAGVWAGGGIDKYRAERTIAFTPDNGADAIDRTAVGKWDGTHASVALRALAPMRAGPLLFTPEVSLNAITIKQDGYTETGAGGANLTVSQRDASGAGAAAIFAVGVPLRLDETWVLPQLKLGARQRFGDTVDDTNVSFASGVGDSFTLATNPFAPTAGIVGLSLTAMGGFAQAGVDAQAEFTKETISASARLVGRIVF